MSKDIILKAENISGAIPSGAGRDGHYGARSQPLVASNTR